MERKINLSDKTLEKEITLLEKMTRGGWRVDAIEVRSDIGQAWADITYEGGFK